MLVTDKFVFVHEPKQGGSFVSSALFRLHDAKWSNLKHLQAGVFNQVIFDSKFGKFTALAPALKHGHRRQIPPRYRHLPILATIRNPYDWYVSQYEFGWWKKRVMHKYFSAIPDFKTEFSNFPELSFTEFINLSGRVFDRDFDSSAELIDKFGWRTRSFLKFYCQNPGTILPQIAEHNFSQFQPGQNDWFENVNFISTTDLNRNLHDFLIDVGYPIESVEFILEMKKVLPAGKGRTADQHWEKYYSPELKKSVRQKDRILFELFPEFDV